MNGMNPAEMAKTAIMSAEGKLNEIEGRLKSLLLDVSCNEEDGTYTISKNMDADTLGEFLLYDAQAMIAANRKALTTLGTICKPATVAKG